MAITNEEANKTSFIKETNTATDEVRRVISPANFQVGSPKKSANLNVYGGVTTLSGSSPALITHGDIIITGSIYTTGAGGKLAEWSHSTISTGDIYYNGGDVGIGTADPQTALQIVGFGGNVAPSATVHAEAIIGNAEIGAWPVAPDTFAMFGNSQLNQSIIGNYAILQAATGQTFLNAAAATSLSFQINGATGMRLTANSDLGIGTTDPQTTLQVGAVTPSATTHADAIIGRAEIGDWPAGPSTYAMFGNSQLDQSNTGNYAVLQANTGATYINAAATKTLNFSVDNSIGMTLTAGGEVLKYNQPMCNVRGVASTPTITTTATKLQLNGSSEDYDPENLFDAVTNYRFTAPATGRYLIHASYGIQIATLVSVQVRWITAHLYKNGSSSQLYFTGLHQVNVPSTVSNRFVTGTGMKIMSLIAGDFLELWHDSSDTTANASVRSDVTSMAIYLLG